MRERVELAAGRFELQSSPLNGTEVAAWLPISPSDAPNGRRVLRNGHGGAAPEERPAKEPVEAV
jgi:hypothetical protein